MAKSNLTERDRYWAERAQQLIHWRKPFTQVSNCSFVSPVHVEWFSDATLNVSENCLDRHLIANGDRLALIWEPDQPSHSVRTYTYAELHSETCRLANALSSLGVQRADRVMIYMPMVPEAVVAMLACSRLGAIHCVVFAGFSSESLADRMNDCQSSIVITADEAVRGGKTIALKTQVDEARKIYAHPSTCVVLRHTGCAVPMGADDHWYHDLIEQASPNFPPVEMNAEDPLFILYTSGSTNKPKGVLHTSGGYIVYAAHTFQTVFDYRPGEIFWCTADIGWITGHSYVVYGPLASGATILLFEGVPTYPEPDRFWQVIDKHKVSIFYTAPTAIRALMRDGDHWVKRHSRKSLRVLGTVGEPINPEAWRWYHDVVGNGRCPVVDTWWQTETGGILISAHAGNPYHKPGSATKPLPEIEPVLIDPTTGQPMADGMGEGHLCLKSSWPGQMRTVYGDHARFEQTYFSTYKGYYFTGDGCRLDSDGDYWITGRVDDVLNVSGHRIGTAEVESALVAHTAVAEAAVVGYPHDIKGHGIYAFVILKIGQAPSGSMQAELIESVKHHLSAIAKPDLIQFVPGLPKTRSGKIMRRILRKIVEKAEDQIGDVSTLADPSIVQLILKERLV